MSDRKRTVLQWAVTVLVLAALVLALQRYCRLRFRHKSFRRGSPNQQALRRWQEVERLSRLRKETPPEELLSLARKARFSQHPITEEELAQFDAFWQAADFAAKAAPLHRKLMRFFITAL